MRVVIQQRWSSWPLCWVTTRSSGEAILEGFKWARLTQPTPSWIVANEFRNLSNKIAGILVQAEVAVCLARTDPRLRRPLKNRFTLRCGADGDCNEANPEHED